MDEKKQNEQQILSENAAELKDETLEGVTGGLDLPPLRSASDPYKDDPKPWLRPHKER